LIRHLLRKVRKGPHSGKTKIAACRDVSKHDFFIH